SYIHLVTSSPEPASYTWTFKAGNDAAGAIADYIGVNNSKPVDVSGGQTNASSSSVIAPSVVVPAGDNSDRLLNQFAIANSTTMTTPSGTTKDWSFRAAGFGISIAMSELGLTTSGATPQEVATSSQASANIGAEMTLLPGSVTNIRD